jgi:hypothetical protein
VRKHKIQGGTDRVDWHADHGAAVYGYYKQGE